MDRNSYFNTIFDTTFLSKYKYKSKIEYIKFLENHINNLLNEFDKIEEKEELLKEIDTSYFTKAQKEFTNLFLKAYSTYKIVQEKELTEKELEGVIKEVLFQKLQTQALIKTIAFQSNKIEENTAFVYNFSDLVYFYFYTFELLIYKKFDTMKVSWKKQEQKNYTINEITYRTEEQEKVSRSIITELKQSYESPYLYGKLVGNLYNFKIKDIAREYDKKVVLDVCTLKYADALKQERKAQTEITTLQELSLEEAKMHEEKIQQITEQYEKELSVKEKEIRRLEEQLDIKDKKILDYASYIEQHNQLGIFRKLKEVLKKSPFRLLD